MQTTNGGCRLPCWWGIIPGETSLREATDVLAPLCGYESERSVSGFSLPEYSGIDASLYGESDGPVEEIWVFGSIYGTASSGCEFSLDESWQLYSLSGLLGQLGTPSGVQIGFGPATAKDAKVSYYELHVFYDELGLVARYMGPATTVESIVIACFGLAQVTDIRLYIRTPQPDGFGGPPWEYYTNAQPLEMVSDHSLETFSEDFQQDDGMCLESPASLWPFPPDGGDQ